MGLSPDEGIYFSFLDPFFEDIFKAIKSFNDLTSLSSSTLFDGLFELFVDGPLENFGHCFTLMLRKSNDNFNWLVIPGFGSGRFIVAIGWDESGWTFD